MVSFICNKIKELIGYYKTYDFESQLILITVVSMFLPFFISGSVMVAVSVMCVTTGRMKKLIAHRYELLLFVIAAYDIIISAVNLNYLGVLAGIYIVLLFVFLLLAKYKITKRLLGDITDLCCGLSFIPCIVAVVQMHLHKSSVDDWRADATFFNPNYYGFIIGFFVLMAVYRILTQKKRYDFYFLSIAFNLIALYLCNTRSTVVVIAGGILVMLLAMHKYKYFGFASIFCVAGISLVTKYPQIIPRYDDLNYAIMKRLRIVEAGIRAIADKPLFGRGIYSYMLTFNKYDGAQSMHLHNLYLDTVMNFGIIGTLLILAYFVFSFITVLQYYRSGQSRTEFILLLGIFAEILIHGFTDIPFLGIETSIITVLMFSVVGLADKKAVWSR